MKPSSILQCKCTERSASGQTALVGSYKVKLSDSGVMKLPLAWYKSLGCPTEICVGTMPGEECGVLFPAGETNCPNDAVKVSVESGRSFRLDKRIVSLASLRDCVTLRGCLRYARIERVKK